MNTGKRTYSCSSAGQRCGNTLPVASLSFAALGDEVWNAAVLQVGAFCGCAIGICTALLANYASQVY